MVTSRNTNYSKPCMNSGDCAPPPFWCFLSCPFLSVALPLSQHTHTPHSAEDLRGFLCWPLTSLCCFTLKALAVLMSLKSEQCFFLFSSVAGFTDSPLPVVWPHPLGTCLGGPVVKTPCYMSCSMDQKKKNPLKAVG